MARRWLFTNGEPEMAITFEVSDACSSGLLGSLGPERIKNKTFSLPIEKGNVINCLERIIPGPIYLFHIGCSTDCRSPSFELTIKHGGITTQMIAFSYKRTLLHEICRKNDWFHDERGERDLNSTAKALSDSRNYYETVALWWTARHERFRFCQLARVELGFQQGRLTVRGLNDIQDPPLTNQINGWKKSILDLKDGPLRNQKRRIRSDANWNRTLRFGRTDACGMIKGMYGLFQASAPQFGPRVPVRKALQFFS